jgi:hypothetical protein
MRCVLLATALGLACTSSTPLMASSDASIDAPTAADVAPDPPTDSGLELAADAEGKGILEITPKSHDFGPVSPGSMSDAFELRVSNVGDGPVHWAGMRLDGTDFGLVSAHNSCSALETLPPGARCSFEAFFKPGSRGVKTALLVVMAADQMVAATLTGTGAEGPHLVISPTTQMFVATVGTMSAPATFVVATTGDPAIASISALLAGADPSQFRMTNDCPAPLSSSGTCTVSASFVPTSPGLKSATITVSSPTGGMAFAQLTGAATN